MKKKFKATIALAVSVAGAACTAGLAGTGFWGGMLHNGFLAATVGGMADWFAVTALFRKPLGIAYRTEIIVRNRRRIMQAVVDFAGSDLLGTDNVMRFVRRQDTSVFLREFLRTSGREKLLPAVDRLAEGLRGQLSPEELAAELAPGVAAMLDREALDRLAAQIMLAAADRENAAGILHILTAAAGELLAAEGPKKLLTAYADDILEKYSGAGSGRGFVISMMGITGGTLADILWEKAASYLGRLAEDPAAEAEAAKRLSGRLRELAAGPGAVSALSDALEACCTEERLASLLEAALAEYLSGGQLKALLHGAASSCMERFIGDREMQLRADAMLKSWLEGELKAHHDVISGMIEARLGMLSDAELVEFVEEKVADDLQMIRINGSVVGALAGMALYALVYTAGQVLGR